MVIDNPPFSIFSKITRFYESRRIPYFLFGPHLTLFRPEVTCHIVTNAEVTYANGAKINTSFVTNLEPRYKIMTAPELSKALRAADKAAGRTKKTTKITHSPYMVTSALLGRIASLTELKIRPESCHPASRYRSKNAPHLFGSGFLLSEAAKDEWLAAQERAAQERAAQERAAQERAASTATLTGEEWEIIRSLK